MGMLIWLYAMHYRQNENTTISAHFDSEDTLKKGHYFLLEKTKCKHICYPDVIKHSTFSNKTSGNVATPQWTPLLLKCPDNFVTRSKHLHILLPFCKATNMLQALFCFANTARCSKPTFAFRNIDI